MIYLKQLEKCVSFFNAEESYNVIVRVRVALKRTGFELLAVTASSPGAFRKKAVWRENKGARDDGSVALREAPGRSCVQDGGPKYHRLRKCIFKW